MAGRGGLAVLLLLLVAVQWAARAEAKTSNLCSKFPSFCDQSELDDDKKGRSTHQRFAETKWRKPKGETEIRGHLVAKRPLKDTEAVELDDAAALRAATIREAEEKLRQAESGVRDSFDKRRTVEDARRKAHLIKEARRKRRQRLEEAEAEEDDEDEMVVEVEEDEDEEDHDDDDDAVVEDEDSEEDDDEEDISEEESAEVPAEEQEDEEYVEESEEEEEEEVEKEEEEEEEEEESDEELDLHDDDPEDDDERRARKKLHESAMRRRKWKEEEARMKRREEERKRAEEEERKKNEDGRKRRIEELRKKKRQEEEARRQKEDEEEQERQAEQQRLEEEERARREAQHRRVREEKEKEEQRRLEEKVKEERRRREEQQKEEERKREEERRRAVERQEKEAEEERERQEAKERDKKLQLERERSRQAEEDERKRKAEDERKRKAEDEERERKRKLDEEEKERKRQADEEERKRKLEEQEKEKERKSEEEKERKRKAEQDEKERKRKLEEDEKERKRKAEDEEKERRRKAEEEENKKLRAEEESKKKKLEEESRKKKEVEEKSKATEREEKPKKRSGNDAKGKVAAKEDSHEDAKDRREDDEEDLTSWMSGFPEFFAPTADDDVKNEECRKQSRIFVQHLAKYKMWALNMYDATAKLPSGVLSGNAIQLGDFDECLGVDVRLRQRSAAASGARKGEDDADDADVLARAASWFSDLMRPVLEPVLGAKEDPGLVHIRGQYCLAGVDLELRRGDAALRAALDRSLAHSFLRGSLNDSAHFVPRFRTLGWGVCVPEACAPRDVELALRGAVSRFQRSGAWGAGLVRARVGLPRGACRVAPRVPAMQRLPPSFFLAGGGLAALLLLALVATIKDTGHEPDELGGLSGVVASFSLRRNWSTLTAREDPGADDIRCIHGIRCVCSLLLYAAHKLVPLAALPFSNRRLLTVLAASPASLLLRGSLMYTDTFLMLSGTLAAFHLSKHLSRGGSLDWAGRLATRVTRLTPTLGLVTVAYAYVLEHLGTGPLWGQLVEENGRICREHMWRNLLYVHNLWPFEQMCAPHTHQLALDMQLSLLVPPLVWLLVKSWPLASPVILVLAGGSTWLRQQAALQHNVSLLIYNGAKPADLYRAADMSYTQATHRASAYLAGVVLGYLLHRVPRKLSAPKVVLALGWLASASLGGWAMFSQRHVARFDYRLDVADAARFNALAPLAWAAAMAWLIFACYTGHGGWLDRLLCARPLVLLSRISYAFYLVQFLVFFYNAGSVRSQREFSVTAALDLWELVLVLALATVVTLLVELPMQSVRSALGSSKRRQSLKWDPPSTPITPSPHELPAAYYYNPGTDVYTSHAKEE